MPTQPSRPVDCRATPCVALTFDDGPVPETAEVVDVLAERGVRATFFVIGQQAKRYPEVLQRATRAGDEIGNHSWSHINLRSADAATVSKQLDRTSDVIEAATGVRPATMRPPYGAAATKSTAARAGLPQILWSLDTRDWDGRSTAAVVRSVLADVQPGAIVLLHDSHAGTRAAAPVIADGLLRKGYALVTVSGSSGAPTSRPAVSTTPDRPRGSDDAARTEVPSSPRSWPASQEGSTVRSTRPALGRGPWAPATAPSRSRRGRPGSP